MVDCQRCVRLILIVIATTMFMVLSSWQNGLNFLTSSRSTSGSVTGSNVLCVIYLRVAYKHVTIIQARSPPMYGEGRNAGEASTPFFPVLPQFPHNPTTLINSMRKKVSQFAYCLLTGTCYGSVECQLWLTPRSTQPSIPPG